MKRLLLFRWVNSDIVKYEGVNVSKFVDYLADGLARAMTGVAVDAYELGSVAGVGRLESGRILEGVGGLVYGRNYDGI